jgi:NAD(P)-dependent dehydrogenase (short-subunit alcohol dehydrogenase family)
MAGRLEGRVAIVTGAGRGIGRGEALALAAEGAAVLVNDLGGSVAGEGGDQTPAEEVVNEIEKGGGRAAANYADVSDFDACGEMIKQALDELGGVDILVNNAGILRDRMVFNMTKEEWDIVIAVHLTGTFNTIKHAAVIMRQQRSGRIINTSSSSGLGNAGQANYSAAKEGIVGITRTVARDLGRYGVTCNAIRPTAATRLTLSPEMEAAAKAREARGEAPSGSGGGLAALDPSAIGALITYLASDEAQNVNGRDFMIRGREVGLYTEPVIEARVFATADTWTTDEMFEKFPSSLGSLLKNRFQPPPKEEG